MEPGAWGYNWGPLLLGPWIQGLPGCRLDARLMTLLCKKYIYVAKFEEVKTKCNNGLFCWWWWQQQHIQ
jgi:hypothetical protein